MSVPYRADVQTVGASPQKSITSVPIAELICEGEKMAEYIDIDAPIDVAIYRRNERVQITIRQLLESNGVKYECSDVVERKHGKWDKDSNMAFYWKCSECGAYLFWRHEEFMVNGNPNYCPNCGADMRHSDD